MQTAPVNADESGRRLRLDLGNGTDIEVPNLPAKEPGFTAVWKFEQDVIKTTATAADRDAKPFGVMKNVLPRRGRIPVPENKGMI